MYSSTLPSVPAVSKIARRQLTSFHALNRMASHKGSNVLVNIQGSTCSSRGRVPEPKRRSSTPITELSQRPNLGPICTWHAVCASNQNPREHSMLVLFLTLPRDWLGAADTSRAFGVRVAKQWKTPHENLDCKVDNSRQARVGVSMPLSNM